MTNEPPPKVVRDLLPAPPARWTWIPLPDDLTDPVTARCTHQGEGEPVVVTLSLYRLTRGTLAWWAWLGRCSACGNAIWHSRSAPDL